MRRRTLADIRVFSKEDKPKSAADDEELVQVRCLIHANVLPPSHKVGPLFHFGIQNISPIWQIKGKKEWISKINLVDNMK